jgi:hypothetical protein
MLQGAKRVDATPSVGSRSEIENTSDGVFCYCLRRTQAFQRAPGRVTAGASLRLRPTAASAVSFRVAVVGGALVHVTPDVVGSVLLAVDFAALTA